MKSTRLFCAALPLVVLLWLFYSSAPLETAPSEEAALARVTLTMSDGAQRVGTSAPDDVEVYFAPKGGPWLLFHLTGEETEWAASLPFQSATVRFGGSEWEHPGELFYNGEDQALCFIPTSSNSQAYTHYGWEVLHFSEGMDPD